MWPKYLVKLQTKPSGIYAYKTKMCSNYNLNRIKNKNLKSHTTN